MFLNEGHKKDIHISAGGRPTHLSRLEMKSTDQHIIFISQKAEKITTALYLITDFLKDKEPFKWEIRHKSIKFLSFINSLKNARVAVHKDEGIEQALSTLSEVLSLLRFGASVKFISQMNYTILRDEYTSLHETLEDRLKMREPVDGLMFPQDFFELNAQHVQNGTQKISSQGQNSNNVEEKKTDEVVKKNGQETISSEKENGRTQIILENKKGMRQDAILQFLKARGSANIKDIAEIFSDCGEKTIQRELLSLVARGIVRKTGERRWSRYSPV